LNTSFYSQEILQFIDADSAYYSTIKPSKFAIAGDYFTGLAESLNYAGDRWLRDWLNESY
jgi:hypothetical protein